MNLPQFTTPKQLAEHTGWSERKLREVARKLGACRIVGNRMILTETDVDTILEASRPQPIAPVLDGYVALQGLIAKTQQDRKPRRR